jgi:hypothetical protein
MGYEPSEFAFQIGSLLANIAGDRKPTFTSVKWADLGTAEADVRKAIGDSNIDLGNNETDIFLIQIGIGKDFVVDISSSGGEAPDPFRVIYFVIDGKYVGNVSDVGD